jgi:hypothetical protein
MKTGEEKAGFRLPVHRGSRNLGWVGSWTRHYFVSTRHDPVECDYIPWEREGIKWIGGSKAIPRNLGDY